MRTRRRFTAEFKAKVALEAIQGQRTIAELAARHELHPNLITQWKRQAIEKLAKVFEDKGFEVQANRDAEVTKLHAKIGQLVVQRLESPGAISLSTPIFCREISVIRKLACASKQLKKRNWTSPKAVRTGTLEIGN